MARKQIIKKFGSGTEDDHIQKLNMVVNDITRQLLSQRLGQSWYNDSTGVAKRDLYTALGYIKDLQFADFYARFKRGDIASRIIKAPVNESWRLSPIVTDNEDDSAFDEAWKGLVKQRQVNHYMARADIVAGIGTYGVLFMGFDDGEALDSPIMYSPSRELLYLMPFTCDNAKIHTWDEDPQSSRFNLPEVYQISVRRGDQTSQRSYLVHHSRIIHIAEDRLENDVEGTPVLEAVFNRLQDLELVAGGSGEMFWRGALPGFNFNVDADTDINTIDTNDLKQQIELYIHGLQRYFRTQGISIENLSPQVVSPQDHADLQLKLIAATKGIPKRILEGAERGELASTQDATSWMSRIDARRVQHVEPVILRPFVQCMIDTGVLPEPAGGVFSIEWPSLHTPDDKDKASVATSRAQALATYVNAQGADEVLPPHIFLRDFLGYTDEQIVEIEDVLSDYVTELSAMMQEEMDDAVAQSTDDGTEDAASNNEEEEH
jgi:uncharacterized protein